ncbi:hypothetical protein BC829DRAFT_129582 [Chytridium lagenaria]|nr:hypothetical protein BC829DRAFT_129582 [Chytridium lagenaria]
MITLLSHYFREDDKNDKELMDLLKSSRLLEDFAASELTGKDRREYLEKKITEIGGKDLKKQKAAPPIRVGIIKAEKGRAQKRLQMAKDMGLYHSSLRSQILNGDEKPVQKKKVNKRSNRELTGSTGTFSGGVLHCRNL